MEDNGENNIDRWSYYYEYLRSNKIRKARAQHPDLDNIIVAKIKSEEIAKAADVRDQLPVICSTPKVLSKFINNSVNFEKAYDSAVSAGGENTTLNQIKQFRELITRADTEAGLLAVERESLLALPDSRDDLIRRYILSDSDLSIIRQRRGTANRLGFAVQLCYLRFPGAVLGVNQLPFAPLLHLVADQLKVSDLA